MPSVSPSEKPSPQPTDIDEHGLTLDALCQRYQVHLDEKAPNHSSGLSNTQAELLLKENGPNILSPPKKVHPAIKFIKCLCALFNLLLILAGILTYIMYFIDRRENAANVYLGAILIIVAIANATVEFVQMMKSASALESFLNMIPQQCWAIREGSVEQIQATNLVLGDVVFVRMGDKIPADLRIFNATDFKVDNSSLTGESDPQQRTNDNEHKNPLEATNLAFNGTLAVNGEAYGIVIRTGDQTMLGQIAGLTSGEEKAKSPLSIEIDNFVKLIASLATITGVVFFVISLTIYRNINIALNFAIGTFVAWVPEGLPATVTMLLTIAAKRMATQNVLVKDLQGVETLGAITLLATDKTGTLTQNQMTVTNIWSSMRIHSALRNIQNAGNPLQPDSPGLREVLLNSTLNSRAKFNRTDIPLQEREIIGDATESGLIRFASQNQSDFDQISEKYPKVFEIPFNSENKWAMSINQVQHSNGSLTLFLKGAPERVLRICSSILVEGEAISLTEKHKEEFYEMYEHMAGKGHRVLAFAQLQLPEDQYPHNFVFDKAQKNYPSTDLTFVGLVSLEDPPKHGVREAIGRCRTAGIRVMMVTGDHPLTAEAIGRKINLMISDTRAMVAKRTNREESEVGQDEYDAIVIHGEQIDQLKDDDWDHIFPKGEIIFARTSPKHKLEIVRRAQSIGHIVGVTGDGVNDSPALKKADLGIAMNVSGSDVSKEAASMILLDDNFASTVRGIEEGRLIFSNLKKSVQYTVSHSIPEIIPQFLYVCIPIPLPLSSILILVVDLGFELFAAISYAWDKPETATGLMKMCPRKPVTARSVQRLRYLESQKPPPKIDPHTGEEIPPGRMEVFTKSFTQLFTASYWKNKFAQTDDEIMVDLNVISWGYFEVGVIECIVSFLAFYTVLYVEFGITPFESVVMQRNSSFLTTSKEHVTAHGRTLSANEQRMALAQGQSIYYLSIMIMQGFNLFASKSKIRPPFGRHIFTNWRNFACLAIGFIIGFLIVYIPPLNEAFGTSYLLSPLYWLIPLGGGVFIIIYATLRYLIMLKQSPIRWNPEIRGLQMHPTIFTLRRSSDKV